MTRKIHLQTALPQSQGWFHYSSDRNDAGVQQERNELSSYETGNDQERDSRRTLVPWNMTRQATYSQEEQRQRNLESMEEKSKRELEWIVRNTERILGPESPAVGVMSKTMMKVTSDLMSAWSRRAAKREGSKAPHVVERLLQRLIKEQDAGNELVLINTSLYNKVLDAWANSSEEGSAERTEEILLRMERMFLQQGNESVKPDEASYNAVVKAYVKNGNRDIAATKAEAIVQRMENQIDVMGVPPNRRSYNLLLYAYANSNLEDASSHAEDILYRMINRYEQGDDSCKPDINSYNQVLTAWARGKCVGFVDRMQSIYQQILALPDELGIQPNADTFNAVMGGWLKSDHASPLEIILVVLETMEKSYATGNIGAKPDRVTINTVTAALIKDGQFEKSMERATILERKYQILSNTVSHNIVIDSWCKSSRPDAPDHVLKLLNAMEKAYKNGKKNMKPDGYTYSSAIGCFVKFRRKEASNIAESLLERMENLHSNFGGDPPTTSVYNAVINSWTTHSDTQRGLKRVRELLRVMEENDGKNPAIPKPNRITYNTVIKAMRDGKRRSIEFAEKILVTLEERGMLDPQLLPNSYSYTSTITAIGRSDYPDKAERALKILQRMLNATDAGNLAATPTTHSYNAVLNACAFVKGDEIARLQALKVAMRTYEMLKDKGTPDHTTYGTLLRICATLVPGPERELLVDKIFQEACESGNVGRLVVAQLKFASTSHQHIRLTGRESVERINVKDFPKAWTRNVRENDRRMAKQ